MSKLKSKKPRKKEETTAAATACEGKENVGGNDPDGDFEKPAKKTKKGKSSTKKGIDDGGAVEAAAAAAAAAAAGNDDGDTKPSASTKQKKSKKDTKKPSSDDAGGKKEGGGKRKKKKSIDAAAAAATAATTSTDTKKKKKSSGKKKDAGGAGGGKQKLSAQTLAMHKKWQDAATDMGGDKIVINKAEAKKVIFDMLHDVFCPMNITQIHSSLKGVIPSPVLKSCLEEMIVDTTGGDDGSDDEDDKPKKGNKKKGGGGAGDGGSGAAGATSVSASGYVDSLRLKSGRNANNVLYFTNHDKSANGGNGLPPDERNELIAAEQKSNQDLQSKRNELAAIQRETKQLLSEPTNEEAEERQNKGEKILTDLQASVEESRQYAGNEKKREQTKKRIRNLADIWWKRRRQCTDFLQGMEDATEGTISVKKCLAGDGQIDIDSDEAIINAEKEMYEMRKAKKTHSLSGGAGGSIQPTDTFIGVQFDGVGHVKHVHYSEG